MKRLKRLFLLLMMLALLLGLAYSLSAETVTAFSPVTTLETGSYALVVTTTKPYYVSNDPVDSTQWLGFEAAEADLSAPETVHRWEVERVSSVKCTIRNPKLGENGYLNINVDALSYGPRQELFYERSGNTFRFYRLIGAQKYYVRITTQNVRRFHGGTGTSSNGVALYRYVTYEQEFRDNASIPAPTDDPFLTIACVTDLHTDWGMQHKSPYVRNSTYEALTRMGMEDKADIVLVGGDNLSDNAKQSETQWPKSAYNRVLKQYDTLMRGIAPYQIWACGNHDYEVGVDEGYDSYAGFETLMTNANGKPLSVYRQKDDRTVADQRYPESVMGIHYNLYGMDFIVLNPPYSQSLTYSTGTLNWLSQRLAGIGKDKTVFFVTHYPMSNFRGPYASGGTGGTVGEKLFSILSAYPNLIYLYGHTHNGDGCYIADDTFEQITSFTGNGMALNDRNAIPSSFIASFMGSMSYSKHDITPTYLNEKDSDIVQALMIYLYKDRIVFQMKNYGAHPSNAEKVLRSWTVLRDLSAYTNASGFDPEADSSDAPQDPSTDDAPVSGTEWDEDTSSESSEGTELPDTSASGDGSYVEDPADPTDVSDQPSDSSEASSDSQDGPEGGSAETDGSVPGDSTETPEGPSSGTDTALPEISRADPVLTAVAVAVFVLCGIAAAGICTLLFFLYRRYRMIKK